VLDFAYGELKLLPDDFWSLSWGEYYRMVRGYHRRAELSAHKDANILAAIYNTIPRKKGSQPYTADDFLAKNRKGQDRSDLTLEERQELAREALEKSKRFKKGVVKTTV